MEESSGGKSFSFGIFAGQSALVEKFVFAACDQSWMAFVAEEEAVSVAGNGEAWERPEAGGWRVRVNLRRALEADDGLRVALLEQHVGPVAAVNSLVVDESLGAGQLVGHAVLALDVAGGAFGAVFVDSELILASRCRDCGRYERKTLN